MDTTFNYRDVVESLKIKLADAEERASQFEAIAVNKERNIKKLEKKIEDLQKRISELSPMPDEGDEEQ
ncbi:hypothetical protein J6TS2_33680 [Heyndrickxia sporothermodurans]|nr:hypothetical protein J6TS2_33680 [Heyndrickxia sporothermodurans]